MKTTTKQAAIIGAAVGLALGVFFYSESQNVASFILVPIAAVMAVATIVAKPPGEDRGFLPDPFPLGSPVHARGQNLPVYDDVNGGDRRGNPSRGKFHESLDGLAGVVAGGDVVDVSNGHLD